ncbi:MAG: 50S ribosomal protein L35 [bacterium]
MLGEEAYLFFTFAQPFRGKGGARSMKTRKSITKRFKITKSGKILRRPTGLDHYRAKKTGKAVRKSRKWVELAKNEAKKIRRLMSS